MIGRLLHWACRLTLGTLFLYAGFSKLYPPDHQFLFAMAVSAYRLLPTWGVIVVARALPWLEVSLGLLLILGWKLRYVAAFAALLLAGFVTAMTITYFRGIETDCGCFGLGEAISPWTLLRDSGILLMAVFLCMHAWRARPLATPSTA